MKTLNLSISKRIAEILGNEDHERIFGYRESGQLISYYQDVPLLTDIPAYLFQEIPWKLIGEKLGWEGKLSGSFIDGEMKPADSGWLYHAQNLYQVLLERGWKEMEIELEKLIKI